MVSRSVSLKKQHSDAISRLQLLDKSSFCLRSAAQVRVTLDSLAHRVTESFLESSLQATTLTQYAVPGVIVI